MPSIKAYCSLFLMQTLEHSAIQEKNKIILIWYCFFLIRKDTCLRYQALKKNGIAVFISLMRTAMNMNSWSNGSTLFYFIIFNIICWMLVVVLKARD